MCEFRSAWTVVIFVLIGSPCCCVALAQTDSEGGAQRAGLPGQVASRFITTLHRADVDPERFDRPEAIVEQFNPAGATIPPQADPLGQPVPPPLDPLGRSIPGPFDPPGVAPPFGPPGQPVAPPFGLPGQPVAPPHILLGRSILKKIADSDAPGITRKSQEKSDVHIDCRFMESTRSANALTWSVYFWDVQSKILIGVLHGSRTVIESLPTKSPRFQYESANNSGVIHLRKTAGKPAKVIWVGEDMYHTALVGRPNTEREGKKAFRQGWFRTDTKENGRAIHVQLNSEEIELAHPEFEARLYDLLNADGWKITRNPADADTLLEVSWERKVNRGASYIFSSGHPYWLKAKLEVSSRRVQKAEPQASDAKSGDVPKTVGRPKKIGARTRRAALNRAKRLLKSRRGAQRGLEKLERLAITYEGTPEGEEARRIVDEHKQRKAEAKARLAAIPRFDKAFTQEIEAYSPSSFNTSEGLTEATWRSWLHQFEKDTNELLTSLTSTGPQSAASN